MHWGTFPQGRSGGRRRPRRWHGPPRTGAWPPAGGDGGARGGGRAGRWIGPFPLAVADDHAPGVEVEVLDAEAERLGQPEATSVQEVSDEPIVAGREGAEEAAHLVPREDGGQTLGAVGPLDGAEVAERGVEHPIVEKREGVEGLVLRGGRHVAVGGEVGEEGAHVVGAETARMGGVVEADVAHDPPDVRLFGVVAVLATAAGPAHAVEERGRVVGVGGGHAETGRGRVRARRIDKLKLVLYCVNSFDIGRHRLS